MRFLLDTDHISIIQRQEGREHINLSRSIGLHPLSELGFSIVSFHEQVMGCHAYVNRSRNAAEIMRGYTVFNLVLRSFSLASVLPFDQAASASFDALVAQRVRLATMDLRIASIAPSRGLILLTRNARDFGKVPGLAMEDWTA